MYVPTNMHTQGRSEPSHLDSRCHAYIHTIWTDMQASNSLTHIHTTYTHAYIHTYIHQVGVPYLADSRRRKTHTCIPAFIHIYMHTYMHTYIHQAGVPYRSDLRRRKYTYMHTYMHTYIPTQIHTYIHQAGVTRFTDSKNASAVQACV
jgi:hypothetical protein